jgi:hypothetical protein
MSLWLNALLALIASLFWMSCTGSRFYAPNTVNLPSLSDRGEASLSGAVFYGSKHEGWEAQAAYSPLANAALTMNYLSLRYSGEISERVSPFVLPTLLPFSGQLHFGEIGVGAYGEVGKNREYLVSLLGLVGRGRMRNDYVPETNLDPRRAEWSFWRYAVQPGVRLRHKRLDVGTAFRFCLVQYASGRIDARLIEPELNRIALLENSSPIASGEIMWTVGYRFSPFVLSLNATGVALGKRELNELGLASNHVSLMLSFRLHEAKESK